MNRPILDNVLPTLLGPVRALMDKKADKKDVAAKLGEKADAAEVAKQLSEKANADEIVKTVNGVEPDQNGNVEVDIPEGFSGSWNDLTEKPFYEEELLSVKPTVDTNNIGCVWRKVSDNNLATPLENGFNARVWYGDANGTVSVLTVGDFVIYGEFFAVFVKKANAVLDSAAIGLDMFGILATFPEVGMYFMEKPEPMPLLGLAVAGASEPEIAWDGSPVRIKPIDARFLPTPVQADYAQNDPEQPDYIKNRLAYTTREQIAHEPATIGIYNLGYATLPYEFFPGNGEEYTINWDGTDYTSTAVIITVDEEEVIVAGNTTFFGGNKSTDIPVGIVNRSGRAMVYSNESGEHTIGLTGHEHIPNKIPREYVDFNPIVGVIDSSYYNYRYLNPARGASIAEVRNAAKAKNRDIIIRLDLDNWQGTLKYMGLTNVSTDGTSYASALLFSTIKTNNVSINTSDEVVDGTMQLEYWYALLEPTEGPPADAFVNFQFAEINLAPGTAKAGYYMRVNEEGFWEASEGLTEDKVIELINAKISAIPVAEEASF